MPVALVSGASTGIGRATAVRLARRGWKVFAGVRTEEAGNALREEVGDELRPLQLDLLDEDSIGRAAELVHADGGGLDALVNNAGIGVGGPLELVPLQDLRTQLEVNVVGHVAVTQALIPALRRASGRVVFVSSIGGRVALPLVGPYAASKHAIEAIADALRVELRGSSIDVVLVEPGAVSTPIWGKGMQELERFELPRELEPYYGRAVGAMGSFIQDSDRRGASPEALARVIEGALTSGRPRARYAVGRDARLQLLTKRLLPSRVFDRIAARMARL